MTDFGRHITVATFNSLIKVKYSAAAGVEK